MTDKKLLYQVMIVVILKLAVIVAAAVYIFGPMRPKIDSAHMERHLLQSPVTEAKI